MKKFTFLPLLFLSLLSFGQARFVVQNQTTNVYSNINDAISAASSGDTLYIPGGGFALSTTTINKTLHWIGTGHYPDSTIATGQSRITSALTFDGNCDNSSFEGIYFTSNLNFGSTGDDAVNISMKKCRVGGTITMRAYETDTLDINFYITESVFAAVDARYGSNCLVEKSLVFSTVNKFYQSFFNHCNFYRRDASWGRLFYSCNSCLLTNNIFAYNYGVNDSQSCEFSYNLFAGALPYNPETSTFTGSNNIINEGSANIFENLVTDIWTFSYDNDYHLKSASNGIGACSDGTDIGIYGSAYPYKEGAVPFYPHVRSVDIDPSATNGQLGVKITVAAQER